MADLSSGSEFAGHRIEDVAGRGGMGVVYRATHLALGRVVALKLIAAEYANDPDFRERFQRESRTAAGLDQPHVLPIYHAGEEDGQLFITMRYVSDTDLRELIANKGRLDPREAATVIDQIGQALDAAHAGGLVHRDVKPANILIASQAGKTHAYLTDFGLTKSTASGGGLTKTGMWVGTLDYVAPEQIQGDRIDGRADVYALAAVLYQALTGTVPYPKDSDVAKLWAHINDPPPSATAAIPDIPQEFDEVIRRGMANDPEERYLSAGDLGRAALAAAEHQELSRAERSVAAGAAAPESVEAVPPSSAPVAAPTGAQATSASPTAGGSGTAPPGSAPQTAAPGTAPPGAPPTAPGKAAGSKRLPMLIGAGVLGLLVIVGVLAIAGVFGGGGDPEPAPPASNPAGEVVGEPIAVGKKPYDVEVGETGVITANLDDGTLSIINPDDDSVDEVNVGGAPSDVEEGEGGIWTTNFSRAITRVDPGTGDVSDPITAGGKNASLAAGEGSVWVTNGEADAIDRVDPSSLETVGKPIAVGKQPFAIDVGDGIVYVGNEEDETVSQVVVGDDKAFSAIDVPARPFGIEYHDPRVYIGTANGEIQVTPFDETSTIAGAAVTLPEDTGAVFIDAARESIWTTQPVTNTVTRFTLESGEQIGEPIEVGASPQALGVGDDFVWVANGDDGTVTKIEPGE